MHQNEIVLVQVGSTGVMIPTGAARALAQEAMGLGPDHVAALTEQSQRQLTELIGA